MAMMTGISWADATWNPFFGCYRVSCGCDNCYAIHDVHRKKSNRKLTAYYGHDATVATPDGLDWTGKIHRNSKKVWRMPVDEKKPTLFFVNSLSDLFHEGITDSEIVEVFDIMNACPIHRFQVLTKRPNRMLRMTLQGLLKWTPNIWAGVTIESEKYVNRADYLRKVPALVRFISAEPLLSGLPSLDLSGIDWLISGGESGHQARPSNPDWHRDLRDRCAAQGVKYHFKQWGQYGPDGVKRNKGENGFELDGVIIQEFPTPRLSTLTGSIDAFKQTLHHQRSAANYATIESNNAIARIELRKHIVKTLENAHGLPMHNDQLRAHALVMAGLDPNRVENVNINAWALVDLKREVVKVPLPGGRTNAKGRIIDEAYRFKTAQEKAVDQWLEDHRTNLKAGIAGQIDPKLVKNQLLMHGFRPLDTTKGSHTDRQFKITKSKTILSVKLFNANDNDVVWFKMRFEGAKA